MAFRGLRRGLRKLLRPAARVAIASLTGGASEAAMRVAKAIGAYGAKRAPKLQPASVTALIDRTASNTAPMEPTRDGNAQAMPGGAPLLLQTPSRPRRPRRRRGAARLQLPEAISAELANQAAPVRPFGVRESF